jgi:hypothetical protein
MSTLRLVSPVLVVAGLAFAGCSNEKKEDKSAQPTAVAPAAGCACASAGKPCTCGHCKAADPKAAAACACAPK